MNESINLMNLQQPIVMGILNATPDSFYTKGKESSLNEIIAKAKQMLCEGATILDVGGMSTRPSSEVISIEEEINRIKPVIEAIRNFDKTCLISIDTYRSEVAEVALQHGAAIINDISGGQFDEKIIELAAEKSATYICMHIQGTPQTMQLNPQYKDVVEEVMHYFTERLQTFSRFGLHEVILDVGFGFGKTLAHNYSLLKNMSKFKLLKKPILAGLSRKSMIYKAIDTDAENALNGTTALNMVALQQGANILRVHDVKEAVECVKLYEMCR